MKDGESWLDFRARNEKLVSYAGRTPAHDCAPERLASNAARRRFVPPDRLAA